jgi:hypothetical protein
MSQYTQSSPYYYTDVVKNLFLDVWINRSINPDPLDTYWIINETYHLRPDLLAFDLYNDSKLWWVFSQRNPNRLKDPLFDFVSGVGIYLPQLPNLKVALGV